MKKLKRIYSNETFIVVIPVKELSAVSVTHIEFALIGWECSYRKDEFHVTCNLETGGELYKLLKSLDI